MGGGKDEGSGFLGMGVIYFFYDLSSILFYNLVIYFCYLTYYFLGRTV